MKMLLVLVLFLGWLGLDLAFCTLSVRMANRIPERQLLAWVRVLRVAIGVCGAVGLGVLALLDDDHAWGKTIAILGCCTALRATIEALTVVVNRRTQHKTLDRKKFIERYFRDH